MYPLLKTKLSIKAAYCKVVSLLLTPLRPVTSALSKIAAAMSIPAGVLFGLYEFGIICLNVDSSSFHVYKIKENLVSIPESLSGLGQLPSIYENMGLEEKITFWPISIIAFLIFAVIVYIAFMLVAVVMQHLFYASKKRLKAKDLSMLATAKVKFAKVSVADYVANERARFAAQDPHYCPRDIPDVAH